MAPGAKVQASKLSPVVTESMIRKLFELIGPLDNLVLIPSPLGAGFEAIIEFRDKDAAFTATHLTGTLFGGRPLTVAQMDVTVPAMPSGINAAARPFTNLTMQQQQAQQAGSLPQGNPMIRMGATIHHPQFNGLGLGMGMGMGMGNQFQPLYSSPHMTLYNTNVVPPQYHQQRLPDQPVDLDKVDTKTVYVGNLPLTVTKEQLEEAFHDCGRITRVNIAGKPTHPTRFAFMDFETVEGAKKALSSTDKIIGDRPLRVNLPRHGGPMPFMIQQAQMMQAPPQTAQAPAIDATRNRYKNILIGLVNRGGDPSLLKKLEELEAGGPLPDLSDIAGLSPDLAALSNDGSSSKSESGPPQTAASLLEKLVSSSRRKSRSRSRTRRRSRSRSVDRDYHRSSRRRSRSRSRSGYSRSSRGYEADYGRYDYREREREASRSGRSRGYRESSRERERERDRHKERERPREREKEKDRERERDKGRDRIREKDRHRESDRHHRDRESERGRSRPSEGDKVTTDPDTRMKSPPADARRTSGGDSSKNEH
ncbi:Protein srek1IP1 [Mortierella sp. GBA30]|nr:Protein srek1IP1 [Mortierella sp. GBA30]